MGQKSDIAKILRLRGIPQVARSREEKKLKLKPARWVKAEAARLQKLNTAASGASDAQMPDMTRNFSSFNDSRCSRDEWASAE